MPRLEDHPEVGPVHPGSIFLSLSGFAIAIIGASTEILSSYGFIADYSDADHVATRVAIGAGSALGLGSIIFGFMFRSQKSS